MTCIVGIADGENVWLGADRAISANWVSQKFGEPKVIKNGNFLFGFSGSVRVLQVLKHNFNPPKHYTDEKTDIEYLVTDFVNGVRHVLRDAGAARSVNEEERPHTNFLVGYRGNLYHMHSDLQVSRLADNYGASGSGYEVALGSLHTTDQFESWKNHPQLRLQHALEASAYFVYGVEPPFDYVSTVESQ